MSEHCSAPFRVAFRIVRCERPPGHPGPHAVIEAGATRVDRETPEQRRARLLREEGVPVP